MRDLQSLIARRWRQIVYLLLAFLVILMLQDIVREIIIFNREVELIQSDLTQDVYDDVQDMVTAANEDFAFIIDKLHENAILHAEDVLSDLAFAADSLTTINADIMTPEEIDDSIIELTKTYNDVDQNHQHYVYSTDGIELLDGSTGMESNINKITEEDELGKQYISLLIDEVTSSETHQGYVSMYRIEDEVLHEYIVFGHLVEDTNMILTTYIGYDQFSEKEKLRALAQIEDVYDNYTNTIYVLSSTGEILYHQNEDAIGLTIEDDTYPVWQETLQIIIDYTDEHDEGFLEYEFYSNYVNGVITNKVAYVTVVEEWDMIVGASSDLNLYDNILDAFRLNNYNTVLMIKVPSYIVMIVLTFLLYRVVKNNILLSQNVLEEEKKLYQKFADLTSEIIIITNKQGELIYTNQLGSQIVYGDREKSTIINFDQIMVEEDGYYILYGIKQDMFVKYIMEEIEFNGQMSNLYIISDVTEKITTERQLEALSMKDELTQLGNRRLMVKDYNDDIYPFVKKGGKAHLAMLDLDDFKPANDQYGHSFGDFVLQEISKLFLHVSSKNVRFYRIGGDEFAVFLTNMSDEQVMNFMIKLMDAVGNHSYTKDVRVGFSAGVTRLIIQENKRRFSDFYDEADQLLYESKASGKHKISM